MNTEKKKKHGAGAFVLAGFSFIPLLGVFIGIFCIIIAVVGKKSNSKLLGGLGFAGIAFSVLVYGSLTYNRLNGGFSKQLEVTAISAMTSLVRHIENYKLQQGSYPNSLETLRKTLKEEELIFFFDISGALTSSNTQREFYYELINNDENYLLLGIGQDAEPFTQDDIFPIIDPEKDKNIGWVKNK